MGPPASGKRTISKMVSNKLRTAHLTPENLIQDADSDLKTEAEVFVKKNEVHYFVYQNYYRVIHIAHMFIKNDIWVP